MTYQSCCEESDRNLPNPLGSLFPLWYDCSGSFSVPQLLHYLKINFLNKQQLKNQHHLTYSYMYLPNAEFSFQFFHN